MVRKFVIENRAYWLLFKNYLLSIGFSVVNEDKDCTWLALKEDLVKKEVDLISIISNKLGTGEYSIVCYNNHFYMSESKCRKMVSELVSEFNILFGELILKSKVCEKWLFRDITHVKSFKEFLLSRGFIDALEGCNSCIPEIKMGNPKTSDNFYSMLTTSGTVISYTGLHTGNKDNISVKLMQEFKNDLLEEDRQTINEVAFNMGIEIS